VEKKPKRRSGGDRAPADARAYIEAGSGPEERIKRKNRCIAWGLIPNDYTNRFYNLLGFNDDGKPKQNEVQKYWRKEQRDPTGF
jgi:hypothetical protein